MTGPTMRSADLARLRSLVALLHRRPQLRGLVTHADALDDWVRWSA